MRPIAFFNNQKSSNEKTKLFRSYEAVVGKMKRN